MAQSELDTSRVAAWERAAGWPRNAPGAWGEWVVANKPYAPAELSAALARSDDWQVRMFVAKNPSASSTTVEHPQEDGVEKVRQAKPAASPAES